MVLTDKLRRLVTLTVAAILFAASLVPLLTRQQANAYGLVASRSITMSTSAASATSVTYHVRFDVATAGALGGIVVEFCDNSPIIGDTTCGAIAGFDIGTPTVSGQSDGSGTDFDGVTDDCNLSALTTAADLGNTNHTLALTDATGTGSLSVGATCFFDLTTVTNPSTANHSFYARIYTYASNTNALGYTLADPEAVGPMVDAGGIALSTAAQITVTAKVQERLTFCVFTTDGTPANTCGATTPVSGTAISLGDDNGVLNENEAFVNKEPQFSIYTNASSGAIVRAKATGTLTSGSFNITAIAAGNGTGTTSSPGSEQFGFCLYESTGSLMTIAAPYDDTTDCAGTTDTAGNAPGSGGGDNGATFAFDTTTAGENLTTTYGDVVATKPAGVFSSAIMPFMANIATTTEPGIYTATMTFIATGTY